MSKFELSFLADEDLEKIVTYTVQKWDVEQAIRYVGFLDRHFEAIGQGEVQTKKVIPHRSDLLVSRCQKHVIFHHVREEECPLILAVFHERMNLLARLAERLEDLGI